MNKLIGLKDLRLNIDKYAQAVKQGRSFVVLRKNEPLFKISPVESEGKWEEAIDFTKIKKGGVDVDDLLKSL